MMIRILILIFIFMCSSYKPVLAGPTPSMSYLMNEPASLLDMGMFKLNMHLSNSLFRDSTGTVLKVNYDFDENRITIGIVSFKEVSNIDKGKEYCREIIDNIKLALLVNPNTGAPFVSDVPGILQIFFSHEGFYKKKNQPKNLYSDLDKLTDIGVVVGIEDNKTSLTCKSPLLSKEIMYY